MRTFISFLSLSLLITFALSAQAQQEILSQTCEEIPADRLAFPGPGDTTQSERTHWRPAATAPTQPKKGVAIVSHGINLRPSKMSAIATVFNEEGYDVLQVTLRGHSGNLDEFKNVTRDQWLEDTLIAYCAAAKRAKDLQLPLIYVGFSLGGLMGQRLLNAELKQKIEFQKVFLFAPALRLKNTSKLADLFKGFGKGFITPNPMPRSYSANANGVPVGGYQALFDNVEQIKKEGYLRSKMPTYVFIDRRDEVVDAKKVIEKVMANNLLSSWVLHDVKGAGDHFPRVRHLILDEKTLGKEEWQRMSDLIRAYLK
jgi:esterase/lipase